MTHPILQVTYENKIKILAVINFIPRPSSFHIDIAAM